MKSNWIIKEFNLPKIRMRKSWFRLFFEWFAISPYGWLVILFSMVFYPLSFVVIDNIKAAAQAEQDKDDAEDAQIAQLCFAIGGCSTGLNKVAGALMLGQSNICSHLSEISGSVDGMRKATISQGYSFQQMFSSESGKINNYLQWDEDFKTHSATVPLNPPVINIQLPTPSPDN